MTRDVSSILDGVDKLRVAHPPRVADAESKPTSVDSVLAALHSFTEIVRYLNTRRSQGAVINIDSEADVQDVLYLMLRPWILDLVPENPTDKIANKGAIQDFLSKSSRIVLEAKYVRDSAHGKSLVSEINDDIEKYRYHPSCDDLIFFIYDPNSFIPDAAALERHLRTSRAYDGKVLKCHGVIKP